MGMGTGIINPQQSRWLKADLHVHTPISRCYESPKCAPDSEEEAQELLGFLENITGAGIDLIAVTDHNEIRAYWRLLEIRDELETTAASLLRANLPIPNVVERQREAFDSAVILPGCELDVSPDIHIIVLFEPSMSEADMDEFLTQAGFPLEMRGYDTDSRNANWGIQQALSEIERIGAIGIAAHADSSKGLYDASEKWKGSRVATFTHSGLFAMEFLSTVTRDKIASVLKQPEYKRDTQLAFIQGSDYHGKPETAIGDRHTWIRFERRAADTSLVFRDLQVALRNPDECVSAPGRPEFRDIQRRLETQPHISGINSDSEQMTLLEYACAFANSGDGTIVIGRTEEGNWVGIVCAAEAELRDEVTQLLNAGIQPAPISEVTVYPEYGSKSIATVRIRKAPRTHAVNQNDAVYLMGEAKPVPLSTAEIIEHAETTLVDRYRQLSITPRLSQISRRLEAMTDSLDILPLFRRIERETSVVPTHFNPYEGGILTEEIRNNVELPFNGFVTGEVVIVPSERPRLATQYIRITPPFGRWIDSSISASLSAVKGPALIIAPGGALHLLGDTSLPVFGESAMPYILVPTSEDLDLEVCVAFLQSSIGLWFAYRCLGSTNYHNLGSVLSRMRILNQYSDERFHPVKELIASLLEKEREFLEAFGPTQMEEDEGRDEFVTRMGPVVDAHNEAAAQILAKVDTFFCEYFAATDSDLRIVDAGLRAARMAVFVNRDSTTNGQ